MLVHAAGAKFDGIRGYDVDQRPPLCSVPALAMVTRCHIFMFGTIFRSWGKRRLQGDHRWAEGALNDNIWKLAALMATPTTNEAIIQTPDLSHSIPDETL